MTPTGPELIADTARGEGGNMRAGLVAPAAETLHDRALLRLKADMDEALREARIADALEDHADEHRRFQHDHYAYATRFAKAAVEAGYITQDEADKALDGQANG